MTWMLLASDEYYRPEEQWRVGGKLVDLVNGLKKCRVWVVKVLEAMEVLATRTLRMLH